MSAMTATGVIGVSLSEPHCCAPFVCIYAQSTFPLQIAKAELFFWKGVGNSAEGDGTQASLQHLATVMRANLQL